MAYDFKRLSDVEVVAEPTESANVLIEENGVIKKAPKTAVGGVGGGELDAIIKFTRDPDNEWDVCTLESGSYNDIVAKLANSEIVNAMLNMHIISGENAGMCLQARSVTIEDWSKSQDPAILFSFCVDRDMWVFVLLPDGECFWN